MLRIKHITSGLSNLLSNSAENSRVCPIRNVLEKLLWLQSESGWDYHLILGEIKVYLLTQVWKQKAFARMYVNLELLLNKKFVA